jgi:hypothetical protein
MDVLSPLFEFILRSALVLLPSTVGWLAFRRLALSKSANAWIYAVTCLLSAVTAAGTLPWALGLTEANWIFLALALFSPAVWFGVVVLCDLSRRRGYGADPVIASILSLVPMKTQEPLILENPVEEDVPVFRHSKPQPTIPMKTSKPAPTTRTLMTIAREIRGGRTSDRRRPKLLPPPSGGGDYPFLRRGN